MKESLIRTLVPIVYALLIRLGLVNLGVEDAALRELATVLVTSLVYAAIRYLESHQNEGWGWLLGLPKAPSYD